MGIIFSLSNSVYQESGFCPSILIYSMIQKSKIPTPTGGPGGSPTVQMTVLTTN